MKWKSGFSLLMLMIAVSMSSCKEEYRKIDAKEFNGKIRYNTNIKTPTDLIYAYDPTLVTESAAKEGKSQISSKSIGNNQVEITAIFDINDDDAIKAEKIVMIAEYTGHFWKVFEIRYNWKNREGYGHTDWGI
jgi:hypothetical protein